MDKDAGVGGDASTSPLDAAVEPDAGPPLRVLFVGNSYTNANDLPDVVRQLGAATPGASIEVEVHAVGGAFLYQHLPVVTARLAQGGLDRVVLQGQSLEAVPSLTESNFALAARPFSDLLRSAGVPGVWYATWARREGDGVYATIRGGPEEMASVIDRTYQMAAEVNGDKTARVGIAWQLALAELPGVVLHHSDGSHPSPAGTLLAACVIFEALTGREATMPDPPPLGVAPDLAHALCAIVPRARDAESLGRCDGVWIDPSTDPEHCGECHLTCGPEDPCVAGVCGCGERTGCSHSCVDLEQDPRHCGACDRACPSGAICASSKCSCPRSSFIPFELATLSSSRADCASSADFGTRPCNEATHEFCSELDCFNTGFGPASGHSGSSNRWLDSVVCLTGELRETTYLELAAFVSDCDGTTEPTGASCVTAVHRYCQSVGAISGFGPVRARESSIDVACVSDGTVVEIPNDLLAQHATRCQPDPVSCSVAAFSYCETLGYVGGFGPVEVTGEMSQVVCMER